MTARLRIGSVVVVLIATVVGTGGAPALTVTPSTGLLDRQAVDVHASGLVAGEQYWITQCDPEGSCQFVVDLGDRYFIPYSSSLTTATSAGTIDRRLQLEREGCAPDGCTVALVPHPPDGQGPPTTTLASVPLTFEATGTYQWPQATLAARFPTPTIDGSMATVSRAATAA